MTTFDNRNRGAIWPNDQMRPDKKDPEFTGSVTVVCPCCERDSEFWVNAWKRKPDAKQGAPSLSFGVKPKGQQAQQPSQGAQPPSQPPPEDDFSDPIPF